MNTDYIQRFLFEDLDIRGRLVCLTGAWRPMHEDRRYPEAVRNLLGNAASLALLLAANQKDAARLTLQVQGSGPVRLLVVDVAPDMALRGYASHSTIIAADADERELLGAGRLAVTLEDARTGGLYQSLVPLEGPTLQAVFEHYLEQSEQRPFFLRLHASGRAVCGLMLEKLPAADTRDADGWNRVLHLANTLTLEETIDAQPYALLTRLFPEELLRVYPLHAVRHHSPYDPERARGVLRGLGREEAESILAELGEVVIRDEMSNHEYRFDRAAVADLFAPPPP
jgi:molecular chaperone Hsp33